MTNDRAFYKSLGHIDQLFLINALKAEYNKVIAEHGEPVIISKNDIDYMLHYEGFVVLIIWMTDDATYVQWRFNTI